MSQKLDASKIPCHYHSPKNLACSITNAETNVSCCWNPEVCTQVIDYAQRFRLNEVLATRLHSLSSWAAPLLMSAFALAIARLSPAGLPAIAPRSLAVGMATFLASVLAAGRVLARVLEARRPAIRQRSARSAPQPTGALELIFL